MSIKTKVDNVLNFAFHVLTFPILFPIQIYTLYAINKDRKKADVEHFANMKKEELAEAKQLIRRFERFGIYGANWKIIDNEERVAFNFYRVESDTYIFERYTSNLTALFYLMREKEGDRKYLYVIIQTELGPIPIELIETDAPISPHEYYARYQGRYAIVEDIKLISNHLSNID